MRKEKDSLGELQLPDDVYYGVQTERAKQNFSISGQEISHYSRFLWCLAAIKKSAAMANRDIGVLPPELAEAICLAADEVMAGKMDNQFVVDVFQGGGQTSANMNMNEVIANRANEILTGSKGYGKVHPNTHVNMCQSTNDVIPSAVKMACFLHLQAVIESMKPLDEAFEKKTEAFADVVMSARTCLQDALPITLGQKFSGYLAFLRRQRKKIEQAAEDCLVIPLGATAVGTGLGTFPGYAQAVYTHLPSISHLPVRQDPNFFDGLQNGDVYIQISGALKSVATGLAKIAGDMRLLSSGPRGGFGEIDLPATQPGSSIMPGKVNPVIPEMIVQVCYQVCGNDLSVSMAVEGGELDLNVWESLIMKCLFESCRLLRNGMRLFAAKCVDGITANRFACRIHAESSPALITVLSPIIGYEAASETVAKALREGNTIKQAVLSLGLLKPEEADRLLDPIQLTDPERNQKLLKSIQSRTFSSPGPG